MNIKILLEIISTENPFSREQQQFDKVKVLLSLQENMDEVTYFKKHFKNTKNFGNLVQINGEHPLTEVYEKLSTDEDVLLKIARPHIWFKKFLCTQEMQLRILPNGCKVWLLENPASEDSIKAAELYAEKKEDGTWIVQATWIEPYTLSHLDYIFYITKK